MELTIKDRIYIPVFLLSITKSGLIKASLIHSTTEALKFTPAEIQEYQLRDNTLGFTEWKPTKENSFNIEFTPGQMEIIKEGIEIMDKAEQISADMIPTISKFISV